MDTLETIKTMEMKKTVDTPDMDGITLEAQVDAFIDDYENKRYEELEQPAVVLSQLRSLYKEYSAKVDAFDQISSRVITRSGIQRGRLLNIEKRILNQSDEEWLTHFEREHGTRGLRTAQDYMRLARTPNIMDYVDIGKERLIKLLRAGKILNVNENDPIQDLFRKCGITFSTEDCIDEDKMSALKNGIDKAIAQSRIRKIEEKNGIELDINDGLIENLIDSGASVHGAFINDLFELKNEGQDINYHLESLCSESGSGDEMLPHIKKALDFPKIVQNLKSTVESIRQYGNLIRRIEQASLNELETYVAELKQHYENQNRN